MRNYLIVVMVGLLSLIGVVPVNSATDSGSIPVTAQLQAGTPDATFKIYKAPNGTLDWSATYTSMSFSNFNIVTASGTSKPAQWVSVDNYVVVVWANGMGARYKIQTAGVGPFSGSPALPSGSFKYTPVYAPGDLLIDSNGDGTADTAQGTMPASATLYAKGKAITGGLNTWSDVYTSESPGSSRMIQVHYGFPSLEGVTSYTTDDYIPATQASGTYTGVSVKLRITAA
jgi:hypothetical protein